MLKKPGAWLPMAMSVGALTLLLGYIAMFGIGDRHADEGAAARIFQLLLAGQLPIAAFFVFQWLPRNPKQTLVIVALQVVAALIPFMTVYFLEL